ncbi:Hypothetical protein R9X50_00256900 [Acrodontium crateriforme]|uniref:Mitochondrial ATPase complex subunit ATP10 n=1 Tax=Acrodontium crateriforme TaxID=150365 RepID=A0AAQ3R3K6_9PEZI|nr:Hypothetical protein R9X50_00256900 [Acrodontium crateriforme]
MKAPSPLGLRALRLLALPTSTRRCYASLPDKIPPPPRSVPQPRPVAAFRPTPSGPDLRKKRDDDQDFTPYPLARPIGMPNSPESGENMGLDKRTLRQRRDDFHNYDKHLAKRAKMTKQIAKPYFRDWSNMRFHKGKVFVANERLFRSEHALYFPNFFGKTLAAAQVRTATKDGYGGLGRSTCDVMKGKVSVVSIVSNVWAEQQMMTFCSPESNPALHEVLEQNGDVAQRVEINHENNFLKWHLMQLFATGSLRKSRSVEEQKRYFMVRRGVSDVMKEAIGLLNDKCGYVYLVDEECKIRWAGSAVAEEHEKEGMVRNLQKLIQEARTPKHQRENFLENKAKLEEAVSDVMI